MPHQRGTGLSRMTAGKPRRYMNGFSLSSLGSPGEHVSLPTCGQRRCSLLGWARSSWRQTVLGCSGADGIAQSPWLRGWLSACWTQWWVCVTGASGLQKGSRLSRSPPQKKENEVWDSWLGVWRRDPKANSISCTHPRCRESQNPLGVGTASTVHTGAQLPTGCSSLQPPSTGTSSQPRAAGPLGTISGLSFPPVVQLLGVRVPKPGGEGTAYSRSPASRVVIRQKALELVTKVWMWAGKYSPVS